jgi:hypothetical protein
MNVQRKVRRMKKKRMKARVVYVADDPSKESNPTKWHYYKDCPSIVGIASEVHVEKLVEYRIPQDATGLCGQCRKRQRAKVDQAFRKPEFIWTDMQYAWVDKQAKEPNDHMLKGGLVLSWGVKNIGNGQITFRQEGCGPTVKITCETERMGKKFVEQALAHFMNHVKIVE